MHGLGDCGAVQAEGCEEILIWRQTLPRVGSRSILANLWLPV
jgi:hypothetical protein